MCTTVVVLGAPTPRAGGLQFYANVTAPIVGLAPTKTSRQSIGTGKGALSDRRREITFAARPLLSSSSSLSSFLYCHHLRCRHYFACNHHCCRHCHSLRTWFALCPPLMSLLSDLDVGRTVIGKFSTLARPLGLLTVMMLSMAMNRFNG